MDNTLLPFIGKEIEGEDLYEKTLFFPKGSVSSIGIATASELIMFLGIKRLYFGANNICGVDEKDIELISNLDESFEILVEFDSLSDINILPDTFLSKINAILTIKTNKVIKHIKIGLGLLVVYKIKYFKYDNLSCRRRCKMRRLYVVFRTKQ